MSDFTKKRNADHIAHTEQREDGERIDNGTITCIGHANGIHGFRVSHNYSTLAHAIIPVAWHVTGAESLCVPIVGVQFRYLDDGSVDAIIHADSGVLLDNGLYMFLSEPPLAAALAMNVMLLSERRRIAAIAAVNHWSRFAHIAATVRAALLQRAEWALPDPVQPCSAIDALYSLKSPANRTWAERAATWMRSGMRNGGAA